VKPSRILSGTVGRKTRREKVQLGRDEPSGEGTEARKNLGRAFAPQGGGQVKEKNEQGKGIRLIKKENTDKGIWKKRPSNYLNSEIREPSESSRKRISN